MRIFKIYVLLRLIDWLNNWFEILNFIKLFLNNLNLFENVWFFGFIEVDGYFLIWIIEKIKYFRIECKLEIF